MKRSTPKNRSSIRAGTRGRQSVVLTTPTEAAAQARLALQHALALDSTLAEVQYGVASIRHFMEWDWAGAEAAYLKTIEINANHSGAQMGYALYLTWMGRPEEARVHADRALALDPYDPLTRAVNGDFLCYEGRCTEAIEEYRVAQRIQPDFPPADRGLAWAYHMIGNHDEALAMIRKFFPGDRELDEALDRGYAEGGYQVALMRYAETLAARPEAADRLSMTVASIYAWAGDKEHTIEWLELAYQAHDPTLPSANSPDFELVHDDPRYQALRRRMGLPE